VRGEGRRAALIACAAGFLGSHLTDLLLSQGNEVVGVDNLITGKRQNIAHLRGDPNFTFNEHDVIEHPASAQGFIAALKPLGCRFTVDAFGSVKVSFSYLEGLAFDFIKIDGVIIEGIHTQLGGATVKAINIVCQEVGMRTIAEFVETKETLDRLREIGVDYVQGFGVARPEPIGKAG